MNLSDIFIRRPVMTTLISVAILIFGIAAYRLLPVNDLPNVDFPVIVVMASLPGASPETMASAVATPLEKQFSTIAGLNQMSSQSLQGSTNITLQFALSKNIDSAAQDVQAAISQAQPQLPQGMPSPPSYRKVNPADEPILYLGISSATLPLSKVDEYAEDYLSERISMITGVAQVEIFGEAKYAVRIQLNPEKLASRGIGIDEVAQAVQAANVNLPTGTLYGKNREYTVQANGQLTDAAGYRPLIVAYRNGSPVRLGELGRVLDSVQNDKVGGWIDNRPAVVLAIQRQPGTNTVQVVDNVLSLLPQFREELPPSVKIDVLGDRATTIRASVNDVQITLLIAICLVVMVIFLFLRNLSATIIPSLALPMAIVATFAVMALLGYSLDNLSLMAIILSVGFIVDDAIVMLENIVRHLEMGKGVLEAAFDGSREISFTILSMTLSLAAVFIPFLFMGGILGRLLHEFAVTIAAAVLVSGFVSLTLTPMLCSRFLRAPSQERHGRLYQATERWFDVSLDAYRSSLGWVMRHRRATILFFFGMVAATVLLAEVIPKGFLATEDQNELLIFDEAQQGISYESMVKHQLALGKIIGHDANVRAFFSGAGGQGPSGQPNTGIIFMHLRPRSERPHHMSIDQIINEMYSKVSQIPGLRVFIQNPPPIRLTAHFTESTYQMTLQSPNTGVLFKYAQIVENKMRQMRALRAVTSDLYIKNPQVNITIDRDKAQTLGVSPQSIEDALKYAYSSSQISTIYAPNDEYWVIMELEPKFQADPATLSMLYVRSNSGTLVPLNTIAKITRTVGPLAINHSGQLPSVTISFDISPGYSLGAALARVKTLTHDILPDTVTASFEGTAQAFESSMGSLGLLLLLTVFVIYLVLGVLYESFIHPLTILSGLPAAGFGALLTLWIFGLQLDLFSFVGIIMLVGLVKKNAIMMIDFALDAERTEGKSPADAIFEGCIIRFRPIMMTTMAALLGTLPIAIGLGPGSESRRPLGVAVVGGLFFAQFLTLYITPVIYTYMDAFQRRVMALRGKPAAAAVAPAPAGAQLSEEERRRLAS